MNMSSLNWSATCVKYLLFIFNLLFVITGIIIISVGVSIKTVFTEYEYFLDDHYFSTPAFLIAIGTIIFFIAFFGCCGAVKENFCMIITFSTLLILIFILEVAAGISGYVLRNRTEELIEANLKSTMVAYNPNDTSTTYLWDKVQRNFNCCGIHEPNEWLNVTNTGGKLPVSCCWDKSGLVGLATCDLNSDNLRKEGCLNHFSQFIEENALVIGGAGLGLAFVQLLGIIFSCHLSKQIKMNYETV